MCSSRKYPYPPPPPALSKEGNRNSKGRGVQKELNSEGVGGCLKRCFSRGLNMISELLINNSFSVDQAFSYFTVTGLQNKYFICIDHLLPTVG